MLKTLNGTITNNSDGTINNAGTINNECGGTINNAGTFNDNGTYTGNPVNNVPCATYTLELKQGVNTIPNGGTAQISEEMTATARTDSVTASEVTFTRTNPDTTTDTQIVQLTSGSAQYVFTPMQAGSYNMKADFGNSFVVEQTLNISFNVVPESMIGTVALIASSLGGLGAFMRIRKSKSSRKRTGTDLGI